jgi:hypothetical protein
MYDWKYLSDLGGVIIIHLCKNQQLQGWEALIFLPNKKEGG